MTDNGPEHYFILIYSIPSKELEIHEFGSDSDAAAEAYSRFEMEHRDDFTVEVVMVGADSIETIHKTHSHYFAEKSEDLFRQFLEASWGPVPLAPIGGESPTRRPVANGRHRRGAVSSS